MRLTDMALRKCCLIGKSKDGIERHDDTQVVRRQITLHSANNEQLRHSFVTGEIVPVRISMQYCKCYKKMNVTKLHNLRIYNRWARGGIHLSFSSLGAANGVEDARVVAFFGNQKNGAILY